jgi:hypothetical protein
LLEKASSTKQSAKSFSKKFKEKRKKIKLEKRILQLGETENKSHFKAKNESIPSWVC